VEEEEDKECEDEEATESHYVAETLRSLVKLSCKNQLSRTSERVDSWVEKIAKHYETGKIN